MKKTASNPLYKTTVSKDKHNNFLSFLRNLGIQKDELTLTYSRGNFYFYEINLSNRTNNSISYLRHELNESQVQFL